MTWSAARDLSLMQVVSARRRRGLFWWTAVLTVGTVLLVEVILVVLHLADAAEHGPAGGVQNYADSFHVLRLVTTLTAIIVGTTAGAGDLSAGVFRDLVATGRSRPMLFLTRIPGALGMLLPFVAAMYVIATAVAFMFAGDLPTPGAGDAVREGISLLVTAVVPCVLAVALGELVGSRGIAIGVALGWLFIVENILQAIGLLGVTREALVGPAMDRLRPLIETDASRPLPMSLGAALITLAAWIAVALAAGAWRASRRDV